MADNDSDALPFVKNGQQSMQKVIDLLSYPSLENLGQINDEMRKVCKLEAARIKMEEKNFEEERECEAICEKNLSEVVERLIALLTKMYKKSTEQAETNPISKAKELSDVIQLIGSFNQLKPSLGESKDDLADKQPYGLVLPPKKKYLLDKASDDMAINLIQERRHYLKTVTSLLSNPGPVNLVQVMLILLEIHNKRSLYEAEARRRERKRQANRKNALDEIINKLNIVLAEMNRDSSNN